MRQQDKQAFSAAKHREYLTRLQAIGSIRGMVSMAYNIDGVEYLTVAEAVEFIGCTEGWVRHLCREETLASRMLGKRLRLVEKRSAARVRETLTTRSTGKKHLAKRPAAKRKKSARRRK